MENPIRYYLNSLLPEELAVVSAVDSQNSSYIKSVRHDTRYVGAYAPTYFIYVLII
jgi:hypothetical protein